MYMCIYASASSDSSSSKVSIKSSPAATTHGHVMGGKILSGGDRVTILNVMSAPTTRMLQAISDVAGNHLLQHRISGRLFLAELVLSACHVQHMICSNGSGSITCLHYFQTRADPVTSQPCDGPAPSIIIYGRFECTKIHQEFRIQSAASWAVLDLANVVYIRICEVLGNPAGVLEAQH